MGHERGVEPARKAVGTANGGRPGTDRGSHRHRHVGVTVVAVVPVRTAGASEHVARAHRRVPPRRAPAEPVRRPRRPVVRVVHVAAVHHPQFRRRDARPPTAAAEDAAATAAAGRSPRPCHEKVRFRLVRHAARARPSTGVPDEHAQLEGSRTSAALQPAAAAAAAAATAAAATATSPTSPAAYQHRHR